jgi:hypothetical protein
LKNVEKPRMANCQYITTSMDRAFARSYFRMKKAPLKGLSIYSLLLMRNVFPYNLMDARLNSTAGDHHRPRVGGIMTDYQKEAKNHLRLPALRTSRTRSPEGREAEGIGRFTPLWLPIIAPPTQGRWWRHKKPAFLQCLPILRTFNRQSLHAVFFLFNFIRLGGQDGR